MRGAALPLLLLLPVVASAAPIEIVLKPSFVARHAYVTVGELAEIRNAPPEQAARVANHRVQLGLNRTGAWRLSRARLGKELRAVAGNATFRWMGSEMVEITVETRIVAANEIAEAAVDYVRKGLAERRHGATVRVSKLPRAARVPEGDLVMMPRVGNREWRARECVHIDLLVDGVRVTSVPVWVDVELPAEALVVTRDVEADRALAVGDVRVTGVNALEVKGTPVTGLDQIAGKRLRRNLSAGEVVRTEDLEAMPSVVRGQQVKVRVEAAGLSLETAGVAAEDGVMGSRIRIDRADNKAWFFAEVVGMGIVAVGND